MFIGRHTNKIDKKGRISVPTPFRDALGDASASVFVFPSFKFPALEAAPRSFIESYVTALNSQPTFSEEQDDLATVIENTIELPCDPEGRVVLPKHLIEHARIGDEAVFVGRGTRFMIWAPSLYEPHNAQAVDRVRARGTTLVIGPVGKADT